MANEYYISAGLTPIDNSTGAVANTYYISAGLTGLDVPVDSDETPGGGGSQRLRARRRRYRMPSFSSVSYTIRPNEIDIRELLDNQATPPEFFMSRGKRPGI